MSIVLYVKSEMFKLCGGRSVIDAYEAKLRELESDLDKANRSLHNYEYWLEQGALRTEFESLPSEAYIGDDLEVE